MDKQAILGGLAGAGALTILNLTVKQFDKSAPRLELLGMDAVSKLFSGSKAVPPMASKLVPASLLGDLISNSMYYSIAKGDTKAETFFRATMLGLIAGIGAVGLPDKLGLNDKPTNREASTKVKTVAWYIIGGLVTATVITLLDGKSKKERKATPRLLAENATY